jgi:hypothetical protein
MILAEPMTMAQTRRGSGYPVGVPELMPHARALASRLGRLPSRNQLMRELHVGAGKASQLLAMLATDPDRTGPATAVAGELPAVLGAIGDSAPSTPAVAGPGEHRSAENLATDTAAPIAVTAAAAAVRPVRSWPVVLLALPALVAIWSGWVGLGGLTGFGVVHPLPGIWDGLAVNTAITLPIGMETYAAYALRAWLGGGVSGRARRFAKRSAIAALALGAAGQVAYHLMTAAEMTAAPWPITTLVACLPVAVLGMGAALAHLLHEPEPEPGSGEVTQ